MKLEVTRYTSGHIAIANLCAAIDALQRRCFELRTFEDQLELSRLLFLRGDLLGRIEDHDRAEATAKRAIAGSRDDAAVSFIRAQLCWRFHRFPRAKEMLGRAFAAGYSPQRIETETAALLQGTGKHAQALVIRKRHAARRPGIQTLGALASLLSEMGRWTEADACYVAALDADRGVSPLLCAQILFDWGVHAMRRGDLELAETRFAALELLLPAHVPGRAHRAEVALERRHLDRALQLITPLVDAVDPAYRAVYAQILAALGAHEAAAKEADRAAMAYEHLLSRRPEAYAERAAAFFMGVGNRRERAVELAAAHWKLCDTPRARNLLARAERTARAASGQPIADRPLTPPQPLQVRGHLPCEV